jgi:hypothetical protein
MHYHWAENEDIFLFGRDRTDEEAGLEIGFNYPRIYD